ncbi:MAG TPA: hypothetical protein VE953_20275 [Terriglobales bacterium]|nr:hypothetical protein [Terriglobales bacterium]
MPDPEHEALRDLVRARWDAKDDLRRARHRLAKSLFGQGVCSPPGIKAWSARHYAWLNQLTSRR